MVNRQANNEVTCAVCGSVAGKSGAVLTDFGRASCPAGDTLLYSGQMAAPYAGSSGGGTNFLWFRPSCIA